MLPNIGTQHIGNANKILALMFQKECHCVKHCSGTRETMSFFSFFSIISQVVRVKILKIKYYTGLHF